MSNVASSSGATNLLLTEFKPLSQQRRRASDEKMQTKMCFLIHRTYSLYEDPINSSFQHLDISSDFLFYYFLPDRNFLQLGFLFAIPT